jgi:hypothetical protein
VKSIFSRWLPAIAQQHRRKAVLSVAGLAFVGAGIVGPATGALASPAETPAMEPVAMTQAAPAPPAPAQPGAPSVTPGAKDLPYDFKLQPNYYYCGPAATRIALTAIGQAPSQDDVAKKLGTTTDGTNSAQETTRVLNSVAGKGVYQTKEIPGKKATAAEMDRLKNDVVHAVSGGRAVVANIAGTTNDTEGVSHSYEGGHYLTVVGYADGGLTVKIADPADTQGDGSYSMSVINLANWIASRGYSA